tara:strand:+ start:379 stop:513 length:135 start_codon:yes stop_codon:yes gene_type:complete
MDYRFTAILIILLCLLALFGGPSQSLKINPNDIILPPPKPKVND